MGTHRRSLGALRNILNKREPLYLLDIEKLYNQATSSELQVNRNYLYRFLKFLQTKNIIKLTRGSRRYHRIGPTPKIFLLNTDTDLTESFFESLIEDYIIFYTGKKKQPIAKKKSIIITSSNFDVVEIKGKLNREVYKKNNTVTMSLQTYEYIISLFNQYSDKILVIRDRQKQLLRIIEEKELENLKAHEEKFRESNLVNKK